MNKPNTSSNKLDKIFLPRDDKKLCKNPTSISLPRSRITFENIGLIKSQEENIEKIYEIHLGNHSLFNNKMSEILVVDITPKNDMVELKEKKLLSNIIAKISHEFTTPIISINHTIKNMLKLSEDTTSNQLKVKNKLKYLCKYLLVLVQELTYHTNNLEDEIYRNKIEVNITKLFKQCNNMIGYIKDLNELKSNSVKYTIEVKSGEGIYTLDDYKIITKSNKELLNQFVMNLLIIMLKIVYKGDIKIVLYLSNVSCALSERSSNSDFDKIQVELICETNYKLDELNTLFTDKNSSPYIKSQGLDISYRICSRISEVLGLNLKIMEYTDGNIGMQFDLDCLEVANVNIVSNGSNDTLVKRFTVDDITSIRRIKRDEKVFSKEERDDIIQFTQKRMRSREMSVLDINESPVIRRYRYRDDNSIRNNGNINLKLFSVERSPEINVVYPKDKHMIIIADDVADIRKSIKNIVYSIYYL